ncbi:hypothetical protein FKM82_017933 [Ascaphus truei]
MVQNCRPQHEISAPSNEYVWGGEDSKAGAAKMTSSFTAVLEVNISVLDPEKNPLGNKHMTGVNSVRNGLKTSGGGPMCGRE